LRLLDVAVAFLTRVPVPRTAVGPDDLRRAAAFFPVVGLGVAGVGIAARAAVTPFWGTAVATVAAIVAMVLVTGAFHEDGLADTADGLWGAWTPAARLAIMRDSRIGTYGTTALIAAFILRIALLLPLGLADFARAAACAHVLGRASSLLLARLLPAAEASGSARPGRAAAAEARPPADEPAAATESAAAGTSLDGAEGRRPVDEPAEAMESAEAGTNFDAAEARAPEDEPALASGGRFDPRAEAAPIAADGASQGPGADAVDGSARSERGAPSDPGRPRLGASVLGSLEAWGVGVAAVVVLGTVGVAVGAWAPVPLAAGLVVCLGCARLFGRRLGGISGDALGAANVLVELATMATVVALARGGLT
jgi:cobalamin synthase